MKKVISVLLAAVMIIALFAVTPLGASALVDGDFQYTVSGGKATIRGYMGSDTSVKIPAQISGYPVVAIYNLAFSGNTTMQYVTIPASVKTIGFRAFNGCTALRTVNLNMVEDCDCTAFTDCSSLRIISVHKNNPVYDCREDCNAIIRTADNELVIGCKTTTIPETVKSIGYQAFFGCTGLKTIIIPRSVKTIGEMAFRGCTGLKSVVFSERLTEVGLQAFYNCTALKSVELPETLDYIRDEAFGYYFDGTDSAKVNGFTISAFAPTSAEFYAYNNGFKFTSLGAIIHGDVNGDKQVNGADSGLLNRYVAEWPGSDEKIIHMKSADVNQDGKVNGADTGILNRYVAGWTGYGYENYINLDGHAG